MGRLGTATGRSRLARALAGVARRGSIAMALLVVLVAAEGCRGRPAHFTWARTPAAGRPSTCPEDAVDFGDGVPTTTQARCSYADGERGLVHVRGKVLQEVPGNLAEGLAGIEVRFVAVGTDGSEGPALARATTDAQGGFSLKVYAPPGEYAVVAAEARAPLELAPEPRWAAGKPPTRAFEDVRLLVPAGSWN